MSEQKEIVNRPKLPHEEDYADKNVIYHSVREKPFQLYGFYNPLTEPEFKRLPDELGENVSQGIKEHYKHPSGGRVRFSTDSSVIILRTYMKNVGRLNMFSLLATAGFDLYIDDPENQTSTFHACFHPSMSTVDGYITMMRFPTRQMRFFTLNFPLHSDVSDVELGLDPDAIIGEGMAYRNQLPVVFYGSSITQGVCASRPGNTYVNMISRRYNMHFLNMGLAGSCRAEDPIVEYLSDLEMCAFVSDYDYNAPSHEYLKKTHFNLYQKIRDKHPTIPYIMITRPNFTTNPTDSHARRSIVLESYQRAIDAGDQNVYFIDGESFFKGAYEDCCTVDAVHPNDLGFRLMAESIGNTIGKIHLF